MGTRKLGFMQLSIIVGYCLFYALYLTTFFGVFAFLPQGVDFTEFHAGQVVFYFGSLCAMTVTLAIFRRRGTSTSSLTIPPRLLLFMALGSALPACMLLLDLGVDVPFLVIYLCCACGGVFACLGFIVWDDLSVRGSIGGSGFIHSIVFALGGAMFTAILLSGSLKTMCILCFAALAFSAFLSMFISGRAKKSEDMPVQGAVEYFKSALHLDVVTDAITISFGFAFVLLYWHVGVGIAAIMLLAVFVDFALNIAIGKNKVIPFVGTLRICMALASVALLLFVVQSEITTVMSLSIIVCVWFVYRTINGASLMNLAASHKISLHYCVGRGKLSGNIGFTIGLVAGLATLHFAQAIPSVETYAALVIIACIILSALLLLPFDSESEAPGIRTLIPVKASAFKTDDEGMLAEKCQLLVCHYKLSPRESEVLGYIVKGRNAKYVSEKLFISESTAKTHISNIYRKTNIHSQQELLDIVEKLQLKC